MDSHDDESLHLRNPVPYTVLMALIVIAQAAPMAMRVAKEAAWRDPGACIAIEMPASSNHTLPSELPGLTRKAGRAMTRLVRIALDDTAFGDEARRQLQKARDRLDRDGK